MAFSLGRPVTSRGTRPCRPALRCLPRSVRQIRSVPVRQPEEGEQGPKHHPVGKAWGPSLLEGAWNGVCRYGIGGTGGDDREHTSIDHLPAWRCVVRFLEACPACRSGTLGRFRSIGPATYILGCSMGYMLSMKSLRKKEYFTSPATFLRWGDISGMPLLFSGLLKLPQNERNKRNTKRSPPRSSPRHCKSMSNMMFSGLRVNLRLVAGGSTGFQGAFGRFGTPVKIL